MIPKMVELSFLSLCIKTVYFLELLKKNIVDDKNP